MPARTWTCVHILRGSERVWMFCKQNCEANERPINIERWAKHRMSHTRAQFVFCLVHFDYTKLHCCAMLLVMLVTRYTHRNMCSNCRRNNQRHRNASVCVRSPIWHLIAAAVVQHKETRPVSSKFNSHAKSVHSVLLKRSADASSARDFNFRSAFYQLV